MKMIGLLKEKKKNYGVGKRKYQRFGDNSQKSSILLATTVGFIAGISPIFQKNKTKGKKAKNGETSSKKPPPAQEESQVLPRNDTFRGFTEPTELLHAERHFNEEKRDGYVAPGYRPSLPKAPECATLDENQKVELDMEMERLTYPIPSRSVPFADYIEYRKLVEMHGVKTNEECE